MGLRVVKSKKNTLVLDIPTKDRGILRFFTSASGMLELIQEKRHVVYFNPRNYFSKESKEVDVNG